MSDKVDITEHITFLPDGGSHHVWKFAEGTIWREETFAVSPVMFRKPGLTWGLESASERGIETIARTVRNVEID